MTSATSTGEWLVSESRGGGVRRAKLTQAKGSRGLCAAPAVGGLADNQGRAGRMGLRAFGKIWGRFP